jgi:DNA polymerase III subunit epsilon
LDFVVIDVETASAHCSSICQVGIAVFLNGQLAECVHTLVNPETEFSTFNISIHGIYPEHVAGRPTWREFYPRFRKSVDGCILASHTFFDREAVVGACLRYDLDMFACARWIDTCAVARRTWPELPNHKLASLAKHFGIEYRAHDAAEDARAAGEILLLAIEEKKTATNMRRRGEGNDLDAASASLLAEKK